MRRIDESEWSTSMLTPPAPWRNGRVSEVCVSRRTGEVVLLGIPDQDDEDHNCDAMGCGQWHVLWRWRQ